MLRGAGSCRFAVSNDGYVDILRLGLLLVMVQNGGEHTLEELVLIVAHVVSVAVVLRGRVSILSLLSRQSVLFVLEKP